MPDLTPLFGILIVDREPFTFADLPGLFQVWLQDAGAFAFIGLIAYSLYVFMGRRGVEVGRGQLGAAYVVAGPLAMAGVIAAAVGEATSRERERTADREHRFQLSGLMVSCLAAAFIAFSIYGFFVFLGWGIDYRAEAIKMKFDPTGYNKYIPPEWSFRGQPMSLAIGGLFSLIGIGAPFVGAMFNLVARASSNRRVPSGTMPLSVAAGLLLVGWVTIGAVAWFGARYLPAAKELIGGAGFVAAVLLAGFLANACRLGDRLGAVYAVAKLSVLEVVRRRIFLAPLVLLVPFLFPITWFLPSKSEDELRLTVEVTTGVTMFFLLLMSAALTAFAIPGDVKTQNIYTVLTKPVQPFDMVLGRILGFTGLATVGLAVATLGSWALIEASNVSPKAREETFKARVPIRGSLAFASRTGQGVDARIDGTDVGREFSYRKYIAGDPRSSQRAVWSFRRLPSSLRSAADSAVPVEFTFDIYRMTKGVENRGVDVNIRIVTWRCPQLPPLQSERNKGEWRWGKASAERDKVTGGFVQIDPDEGREAEYVAAARAKLAAATKKPESAFPNPLVAMANARTDSPEWAVANDLAREFGFYEIPSKEVFDYHPTTVRVPAALFENADARKAADGSDLPPPPPERVRVYVKCDTSSQMLGVAEGDLYLLEAEQSFGQNYLKAAVGLWCRLVVVIVLATVLSTYLVGVVSFLAAAFLFVLGYFGQYITELALGKSTAGGPFKSISQLSQAKLSTAAEDGSAVARTTEVLDTGFSWLIRRVVNLFPDVYAYDWTAFVSEGFNVSFESLVMNLIVMTGYLLPWLILGFYLIRSREVAA